MISQIVEWTQRIVIPLGPKGLFALAFVESSFFPVPPDLVLIVMALANPELALFYAAVSTVGSTLGGIFGYCLGIIFGKPLLRRFVSKEKIQRVHNLYNKYEAWAVGIAGFTPLPYKVFTIAGRSTR